MNVRLKQILIGKVKNAKAANGQRSLIGEIAFEARNAEDYCWADEKGLFETSTMHLGTEFFAWIPLSFTPTSSDGLTKEDGPPIALAKDLESNKIWEGELIPMAIP